MVWLGRCAVMCSTPVGITARRTPGWRRPGRGRDVLNACRHHGKEDRPMERRMDDEDQVLNACRHHGKEDSSPRRPLALQRKRAQRLSASRQGGHDEVVDTAGLIGRCSTPVGITARRTRKLHRDAGPYRDVLNACRHHGKEDPESVRDMAIKDLCSTPVGITARRTPSGVHRVGPVEMCSTPVGITARRTTRLGSSGP